MEIRALLAELPGAAVPAATGADRWRRPHAPARAVRQLYAERAERAIWSRGDSLRPAARRLLAALGAAREDGLDRGDYGVEEIRFHLAALDAAPALARDRAPAPARARHLAAIDVALTRAFLDFGAHLLAGRVDPRRVAHGWHTESRRLDLGSRLLTAAESGEVGEALRAIAPPHAGYAALRRALAEYRVLQAAGGWAPVPDPGEVDDRAAVEALRVRLAATGDLAGRAEPGAALGDDALAAAVRRFQERHGLEPTGEVDGRTLAELNVPVEERLRQIELNLERWRWLPQDLGERHLLVNIPAFTLDFVERGASVGRMRVVVGATRSPTPVFSDRVTHLELNPFWNVPPGILRDEILPAVRRDPDYLRREGMELLAGFGDDALQLSPEEIDWSVSPRGLRVRQRPGGRNSLGRIKFLFPNRFHVYLHDTPADHLFARAERGFSHGCVRLERPLDLAAYLLGADPSWSRERLAAAIAAGERRGIRLPQPVPIHLLYWTAWVDGTGALQFRRDLYGRDAALLRALDRSPRPPSA
jgi:murein L,D-transpeptidase YcbB/YkuD